MPARILVRVGICFVHLPTGTCGTGCACDVSRANETVGDSSPPHKLSHFYQTRKRDTNKRPILIGPTAFKMIIVICLVMALLVVLYLRSNRRLVTAGDRLTFLRAICSRNHSLCCRLCILSYSTHVELEAKDEELLESQRACYRLKTSLESEQAQAVRD